MDTPDIAGIAVYSPSELPSLYQKLLVLRMELDRKFSDFLRENEFTMGEDFETPIWKKYKTMNREYTQVVNLINQAEFYLKKG